MEYKYIRPFIPEDREGMYEWLHDDNVISWFSFDGKSMDMNDVDDFIRSSSVEGDNQNYAIVFNNEYAGTISLKNISTKNGNAEVAIAVRTKFQGMNVAANAMKELFVISREKNNLHKLYLNVMSDNKRARTFYEKMGFRHCGTSKDHIKKSGIYYDLDWYEAILEDLL